MERIDCQHGVLCRETKKEVRLDSFLGFPCGRPCCQPRLCIQSLGIHSRLCAPGAWTVGVALERSSPVLYFDVKGGHALQPVQYYVRHPWLHGAPPPHTEVAAAITAAVAAAITAAIAATVVVGSPGILSYLIIPMAYPPGHVDGSCLELVPPVLMIVKDQLLLGGKLLRGGTKVVGFIKPPYDKIP